MNGDSVPRPAGRAGGTDLVDGADAPSLVRLRALMRDPVESLVTFSLVLGVALGAVLVSASAPAAVCDRVRGEADDFFVAAPFVVAAALVLAVALALVAAADFPADGFTAAPFFDSVLGAVFDAGFDTVPRGFVAWPCAAVLLLAFDRGLVAGFLSGGAAMARLWISKLATLGTLASRLKFEGRVSYQKAVSKAI